MSRFSQGAILSAAAFFAALIVSHSATVAGQASESATGSMSVSAPWSMATPGNSRVGAGYLIMKNLGSSADRLIAVETDIAARAQVHEMKVQNGMMQMQHNHAGLHIPAGATLMLAPGKTHLMFMGLRQPIRKPFNARLLFENAGTVNVTFQIAPAGATSFNSGG